MNNKSSKDTIFLILSLAIMIGSRFVPPFGGLSSEAIGVLGVFFGSLLMWITISIDWPSMITLLALGFIPTFGFSKTFSGAFGNIMTLRTCVSYSGHADKEEAPAY